MVISELSLILAITFTINSGADVPKETMVRPMTSSETENLIANADAPSTR